MGRLHGIYPRSLEERGQGSLGTASVFVEKGTEYEGESGHTAASNRRRKTWGGKTFSLGHRGHDKLKMAGVTFSRFSPESPRVKGLGGSRSRKIRGNGGTSVGRKDKGRSALEILSTLSLARGGES